MLVAVAVLMILMSGFTMLFTGSVRTVRTAMQQNDAYDQATGALNSIKLDLMSSFNATEFGDKYSFYGTPIGMTFVGVIKNVSEYAQLDPGEADLRLARVTYVLYHTPNELNDVLYANYGMENQLPVIETFPEAFEQAGVGMVDAYTYPLLRYVEPNAADLDSFPYPLDAPSQVENWSIGQLIDEWWDKYCAVYAGAYMQEQLEPIREDFYRAKRREIWIRMLAGGDSEVPNAWANPEVYLGRPCGASGCPMPHQYVVTGNIALPVPPYNYSQNFYVPNYSDQPFIGPALFDYDYARPGDYAAKPANGWWNDRQGSSNCAMDPADSRFANLYCADPCLPEIVSAAFFLMFEAPYVSAPDFQKRFTMQINLPTGYTREAVISGLVWDSSGAAVAGMQLQVWPDTDTEIFTDASGYYSVSVPHGWSGRITVPRLPQDCDSDECVAFRQYVNVTTSIENQNYAVQ